MKLKMILGSLSFLLIVLMGTPALYAVEGEFEEVFTRDDTDASDPSAFEGDSENMPGERAPEEMPMDDAPMNAGMGVSI